MQRQKLDELFGGDTVRAKPRLGRGAMLDITNLVTREMTPKELTKNPSHPSSKTTRTPPTAKRGLAKKERQGEVVGETVALAERVSNNPAQGAPWDTELDAC